MKNIEQILRSLEQDGNRRMLRTETPSGKHIEVGGRRYLNMSSNDYLGLACDISLQREFLQCVLDGERFLMGSSASRLMTGNTPEYGELEKVLSGLYPGRTALVLGSGYAVNSALLPALTSHGNLILADKSVHASIVDGLRMCECPWHRFRHNDMEHLESLLRKARNGGHKGEIWVAAESVYSMDGDKAPLKELAALKDRYGFSLYLDEAHAFGILGPGGSGLAAAEGMTEQADIIVGTLGKAAASAGGFVVSAPMVRELLINRMRTLIFSTALPPVMLMWSKYVIDRMPDFDQKRRHLAELSQAMAPANPDATHIHPVMAYDNHKAVAMAEAMREAGFWVTPVKHPTVPAGKARIRVSLTAAMDMNDIEKFKQACDFVSSTGKATRD